MHPNQTKTPLKTHGVFDEISGVSGHSLGGTWGQEELGGEDSPPTMKNTVCSYGRAVVLYERI